MKPLAIVGVLLIVVGIAGLILGRFSYTTQETVLDVGPIKATAEKEHSINIPDIAAIVAVTAIRSAARIRFLSTMMNALRNEAIVHANGRRGKFQIRVRRPT